MAGGAFQAGRPLAVAAAIACVLSGGLAARADAAAVSRPARARALASYGKLPLAFVPNAGQTDARVRYLAHSGGSTLFFTDRGVTMTVSGSRRAMALELPFKHANHKPRIVATRRSAGVVSYFGRGRGANQAALSTFEALTYRGLWPGVDLTFRGTNGRLTYEVSGALGSDVELAWEGADRLPRGATVSADRERSRALRDESAVEYSTLLGGAAFDTGNGVAVDARGSAYITGETLSTAFPTSAGAFDRVHNGTGDAYVTKLNPSGSAIEYSTFLGGADEDDAIGIAVDAQGSAYVTGATTSAGYPTTANAFDRTHNGGFDAFVTRLNPAGTALEYSTFLGGANAEDSNGIVVDNQRNAYVTGSTQSPGFPTTANVFDASHNGSLDVFVTKLDTLGRTLVYSTFLGGTDSDDGRAIAVDGQGSAFVTGATRSPGFPTTVGAVDTGHNGGDDAFVTKLTPGGSGLAYSTFVGSSLNESGFGIALDGQGGLYVSGGTDSPGFPTSAGANDTTHNGNIDAFAMKLDVTPPDTTITDGPSGPTDSTTPSFSFTSDDTGAGFRCRLDGPGATSGSEQSCGSPQVLGPLADGAYTFSVRAVDARGNADDTPASRAFKVVAPAPGPGSPCTSTGRKDGLPVGVSIAAGARYTKDPKLQLTIIPPDAATGLSISNDGGFKRPFTGPLDPGRRYGWALDSSGPERLPKTVYVRFSGACVDPSQAFQDDIILDETAPTLSTPTVRAPAKGRRGALTLGLKASDNASGVKTVEVRRRNKRLLVAAYRRKLRLRGTPQNLTVRVKDGAGNTSRWKKVKVLRG
jgi:hypothetical protein